MMPTSCRPPHSFFGSYLGVSLDLQGAPVAPQAISLPGTMTVQRDPSGDLVLSFRVPPAELGAEGPSARKRTVRNENTDKMPAFSGEKG